MTSRCFCDGKHRRVNPPKGSPPGALVPKQGRPLGNHLCQASRGWGPTEGRAGLLRVVVFGASSRTCRKLCTNLTVPPALFGLRLQANDDGKGHELPWGQVSWSKLYGPNGWCNSDAPEIRWELYGRGSGCGVVNAYKREASVLGWEA